MANQKVQAVICGAGIAGVSAAYFLAVRQRMQDILLVDERPPLSLTSDHSTECYRNWWPDPAMARLMNRSIDLLEELTEESGNFFHFSRRGYLYCTGDQNGLARFGSQASDISRSVGNQLRIHRGKRDETPYTPLIVEGYKGQPDGADLLLDPGMIHQHFPFLTKEVKAALHVRRAGWMSAQQLGMYLLEQAQSYGVDVVRGKVTGVNTRTGQIAGVRLEDGNEVTTKIFINAAGPFVNQIAGLMGVDLPVYNELHLKIAMRDSHGVIDRSAPLVVWSDPQVLNWSEDEREALLELRETTPLLEKLPSGVHARPEGGPDSQMILILWEYFNRRSDPNYPIFEDPLYADIVVRGLRRMVPEMQVYIEKMPRPHLDGGYYTRTPENRPLICKLPVEGSYMIGALSGYGIMSACAAGELLSQLVTNRPVPDYARHFSLQRYEDPGYLTEINRLGDAGQL